MTTGLVIGGVIEWMISVPFIARRVFMRAMSVVRERMTMPTVDTDVIVIFARNMRMHLAQRRGH